MKEVPPHEWHHAQVRLLSLEDRVTALQQTLRELTARLCALEHPEPEAVESTGSAEHGQES